MQENKLKEYAEKIWNLEQECQQGKNVSKNLKTLEEMTRSLPLDDLFQLASFMEESHLQN